MVPRMAYRELGLFLPRDQAPPVLLHLGVARQLSRKVSPHQKSQARLHQDLHLLRLDRLWGRGRIHMSHLGTHTRCRTDSLKLIPPLPFVVEQ